MIFALALRLIRLGAWLAHHSTGHVVYIAVNFYADDDPGAPLITLARSYGA